MLNRKQYMLQLSKTYSVADNPHNGEEAKRDAVTPQANWSE